MSSFLKSFHGHNMFQVFDGIGFSHRFRNYYQSKRTFQDISVDKNYVIFIENFSLTYHVSSLVSGFSSFFNSRVSVNVFGKIIGGRAFQDPSNDISCFSVAQIFVDFLICIYRGKV